MRISQPRVRTHGRQRRRLLGMAPTHTHLTAAVRLIDDDPEDIRRTVVR